MALLLILKPPLSMSDLTCSQMQQGRRTSSLKASYEAVTKNVDLTKELTARQETTGGAVATGGSHSRTDTPISTATTTTTTTKTSRTTKKSASTLFSGSHCNGLTAGMITVFFSMVAVFLQILFSSWFSFLQAHSARPFKCTLFFRKQISSRKTAAKSSGPTAAATTATRAATGSGGHCWRW